MLTITRTEKVKLLMALMQVSEKPMFASYFKPKELLDETVGALGMWKAPFIKTKDELAIEEMGMNISQMLGDLASSGGPEVMTQIKQLIDSLRGQNLAPEVGGGNGGVGGTGTVIKETVGA
jgi:hypothetical protein